MSPSGVCQSSSGMEIGGERTFPLATAHTSLPHVSLLLHPATNKIVFTFRTFLDDLRLSDPKWSPTGECLSIQCLMACYSCVVPLIHKHRFNICLRTRSFNWCLLGFVPRFNIFLRTWLFLYATVISLAPFHGLLKKEKPLHSFFPMCF